MIEKSINIYILNDYWKTVFIKFISWGVNPPNWYVFLIIKNKINHKEMIINNIYLLKVDSSNPVIPTKPSDLSGGFLL